MVYVGAGCVRVGKTVPWVYVCVIGVRGCLNVCVLLYGHVDDGRKRMLVKKRM